MRRLSEPGADPRLAGGRCPRYCIADPGKYPGWDSLLAVHPGASFFHGKAWSTVLQQTYGHRPLYFCQFTEDRLEELLPVMEVSSVVTGRRGVALPFTDLCSALSSDSDSHQALYELAFAHGQTNRWRYLECRRSAFGQQLAPYSLTFYGHEVDLSPDRESLFKGLDGAIRRGVRKAEGSGIKVEFSNSHDSVREYYRLHCLTRRRHGVPPQPQKFFDKIAQHVLYPGHGFVATARLDKRPLAAAVFFHSGSQAVYKFGASDYAFQHLRPNNLLMWQAIKLYAEMGFSTLHMGRTSLANEGLRRFKLGFGARETAIQYRKYDFREKAYVTDTDLAESWVNSIFRRFPAAFLRLAGSLLYPHLS